MVQYSTKALSTQVFNSTTGQLEPNDPLNGNSSLNSTDIEEVAGFDGETYILNHTQTMKASTGTGFTYSYIEEMSSTGYAT